MSIPPSIRLVCALAVLGATHLAAQTVDVFGGYTLASMKPEQNLSRVNMHGWNTSLAWRVSL